MQTIEELEEQLQALRWVIFAVAEQLMPSIKMAAEAINRLSLAAENAGLINDPGLAHLV